MDIRQTVIEEMERRKLTVNALAKMSGVAQPRLYAWINNGSGLVSHNIEKVLDALKIKIVPSRTKG